MHNSTPNLYALFIKVLVYKDLLLPTIKSLNRFSSLDFDLRSVRSLKSRSISEGMFIPNITFDP